MNNLPVTIIPIPALKDNYIWALVDKMHNTMVIVDPGDADPVEIFLQKHNLSLKAILITHHHWDHTNGINKLVQKYHVSVFGPAQEYISGLTTPVGDKDEIKIESFPLTMQILTIPGHTTGHIAFYAPGILFCGDTLFAAGCGRIFEGSADEMYASLKKIFMLPDDTQIYCAHEYTLNNLNFAKVVEPSNHHITKRIKEVSELREKNLPSLPSLLADEKASNPFLRCNSPEIKANVEKFAGHSLENPIAVFTWLRKWKDGF